MRQWLTTSFILFLIASLHCSDNCPVVDFGDDYCWHGGAQGLPVYRGIGPQQLYTGSRHGPCPVDVDGDGETTDDSVAYYPFSLDEPLNQHGTFYNNKGNNARFYGGMVTFWANRKPKWSEGGINIDHDLRDDFNLHSYATDGGDVGLRTYGLWLWKKEDFINGGDAHPVSFDEDSRLAVYVSRYWKDYEEGRFVVQDGDTFYISEHSFGGKTHTLYNISPLESRWAPYQPHEPYHISFDPAQATFSDHTFTDVRSSGWYIAKPTLGPAALWIKWYAFSMDAVVNAPPQDTRLLTMQKQADDVQISTTPLSYAHWRKIYTWSNRNQYALHAGYSFIRDGDMGNMDLDDAAHSATEPVTDITWIDALLWCNALSEYEGKRPLFYSDADLKQVFRLGMNRFDPAQYNAEPEIFIDWSANGFRPATVEEQQTNDGLYIVFQGDSNKNLPDYLEACRTHIVPNDISSIAGDPQLDMVPVEAGTYVRRDGAQTTINPFSMSRTEITFAQWKKVYAWASTNNYTFDRDGDLGSMDWSAPNTSFTQDQPVTEISHNDMLLWCNALSEMNNKTPVYYINAEKTDIYKQSHRFRMKNTPGRASHHSLPDKGHIHFYIKWEADGYRLPSQWEWEYVYRAGNNSSNYPWPKEQHNDYAWQQENSDDSSHATGGKTANPWGFHDMAGNVYEVCLGGGNSYYTVDNPRGHGHPVQMGGSFRSDKSDMQLTMRCGGSVKKAIHMPVATAYPEIGFRVLRCDADTHPPEPPPYIPTKVLDFDTSTLDAN